MNVVECNRSSLDGIVLEMTEAWVIVSLHYRPSLSLSLSVSVCPSDPNLHVICGWYDYIIQVQQAKPSARVKLNEFVVIKHSSASLFSHSFQ
jgi:hypothetical protein